MTGQSFLRVLGALLLLLAVSACGNGPVETPDLKCSPLAGSECNPRGEKRTSIFDAFSRDKEENTVQVNRYLWSATLEVLDFLPIQTVDPFTGLIVTGFGTPPNGGRAYRATILIRDPALDARSLNVSLSTRGGAASAATVRAIEDAILTRARQLRQADRFL